MPRFLGGLKFDQTANNTVDAELDPAYNAAQEFARIRGKRANKTQEFCSELYTTPLGTKLVVLSVVDEAVRFLQMEFLRCSDGSNRMTLWRMANPEVSPLTAACQYLTSLLFTRRGDSRVILLVARDGFDSIEEWERNRPEQVRYLRRMILLANAWIQRRHCDRLFDMPWSLCSLADPDVSPSRKADLVSSWNSKLGCCLRPGMARRLKARGVSGEDLLSPKQLAFSQPKLFNTWSK